MMFTNLTEMAAIVLRDALATAIRECERKMQIAGEMEKGRHADYFAKQSDDFRVAAQLLHAVHAEVCGRIQDAHNTETHQ